MESGCCTVNDCQRADSGMTAWYVWKSLTEYLLSVLDVNASRQCAIYNLLSLQIVNLPSPRREVGGEAFYAGAVAVDELVHEDAHPVAAHDAAGLEHSHRTAFDVVVVADGHTRRGFVDVFPKRVNELCAL